ncbi:MAG: hypothetical protein HQL51_16080 [Magnetococcales bacterium]|nr:hypothetical protein [Magnetococcales bacterium]
MGCAQDCPGLHEGPGDPGGREEEVNNIRQFWKEGDTSRPPSSNEEPVMDRSPGWKECLSAFINQLKQLRSFLSRFMIGRILLRMFYYIIIPIYIFKFGLMIYDGALLSLKLIPSYQGYRLLFDRNKDDFIRLAVNKRYYGEIIFSHKQVSIETDDCIFQYRVEDAAWRIWTKYWVPIQCKSFYAYAQKAVDGWHAAEKLTEDSIRQIYYHETGYIIFVPAHSGRKWSEPDFPGGPSKPSWRYWVIDSYIVYSEKEIDVDEMLFHARHPLIDRSQSSWLTYLKVPLEKNWYVVFAFFENGPYDPAERGGVTE